MPTDADPIVNNWYAHLDKGQRFCVVALDDDTGLVEIQYYDGTVEEIERDAWYGLAIEPAEAPENWTGAEDVVEIDDLGTEITDTSVADWNEPLEEIKPEGKRPEED